MSHVLFTGGGTAGHVVPTLPVIEALRARGVHVSFVGSTSGLEAELVAPLHVPYYGIAAGKLRRYLSAQNVADAFRVLRGVGQAFRLLGRLRPDVVFSKGGFVSFPVVAAAWARRIPVVAHESDFSPGLANRLAMPFVATLCVNFPATSHRFSGKVLYTGTPLRRALVDGDPDRGRRLLQVAPDDRILLVTGGSLGADALNRALRGALPMLTPLFVVVHVAGAGKVIDHDEPRYRQFAYVGDDWGDIIAAADLVISRAGANTLYELLALGKPNLLVPLSRRASRGDQIENARYAESLGYSRVLAEEDLDPDALLRQVRALDAELPAARARLATFRPPDALTLILAELESHLRGKP